MSAPGFGRTTPLQGTVLALGGIICGVPDDLVDEVDRIAAMKAAREKLREVCGRDFAYDLSAWHQFLQTSDNFRDEYTFHYAWKAVSKKICELISDEERLRLVSQVEIGS